jgi:hypothetical protein
MKNGVNISGATSSSYTISSVTTNDAAGYSVLVVNGGGSVTSSTATLTVLVPAAITSQPQSQAVIPGQNTSFSVGASGTAPFSYQWSFNGTNVSGATTATLTLTNVQPANAGNYAVVITNVAGSVTSAVAILTVYVPPTITTQPQSQAVAKNDATSFSVVAGGTAPLSYQWNLNGTSLSGATSSTLTLAKVRSGNVGSYTVMVTNSAGSVTSAVAVLTMDAPPYILTQPQNQTVNLGQNASFSVGAIGLAPVYYQWRLNGSAVAGATNSTLLLTNIQPNKAGNYTVLLWNSKGWVISSNATLTVIISPGIQTQPASQALVQGQNATFSVGASGLAPLNYQWSINGTNLAGATNSSLVVAAIDPTDAGSYSVVVTNLAGSATSSVAILNIIVPAAGSYLEAVATNNPLAYWRLGELSGTTAFDCVGGNNATYANVTLNRAGALATDSDPSAAFNGTSAYAGTSVSLANNLPAFTLEAWFKLTAATARMGLFGQNDAIELGFNATNTIQIYTGNGGSLTVTNIWSTNSWHHIAAVGTGTNLFMYVDGNLAGSGGTVTNNYGSSTYLFNIGGGGVFDAATNWFNGGLDEIAVYGHALAATDIKRHYLLGLALPTITLTAPTNNATFMPPATINPAATVVTNGHTITKVQFYNGASLLGEDTTAPYTNSWSAVGPGTYSLSAVVIYDLGSVTSSVATVTVLTPPTISSQPQSQAVITGQSAAFSVSASGTSPLAYRWKFNGNNISYGTNATLALTNVQTTNAGNYTVVVTNFAGSITSSVAALTVYVPPTITSQPASQSLILGQNATFSVGASGTAPLSYQWSANGTSISNGTNASLTLTNIQTTDAASYSVVVTNIAGSATSSVATLTVYVPPTIMTQPQSLGVAKGQDASFTVAAAGSSPFTYQWYLNGSASQLGGETSPTLQLSSVATSDAGNYTVVVANAGGSVTSQVATLTVYVPPTITTQPRNLTVTQGQNAAFTVVASGTVPLSYQWNFNGTNISDATNASLTLTNVQGSQAGSYTVLVTNLAGSITSAVATLTVKVPPAITTQPQSQMVAIGQNAAFSVVASGTATLTYQWYFNGAKMGAGSTSSTLTRNSIGTNSAGNYTVVVKNNWGSATSEVATLTIALPPTVALQPQSQSLLSGQTAAFSVTANGTAPFSYQWSFNGANMDSATNTSLTLADIQATDAGNYWVVITNFAGSVTSAVATLTVLVLPTITVSTQPQSQAVIQGQTASFFVAASGTAPFSYQWNFNGTNIDGATNSLLTLTNVQAADAGNYSVVITNFGGSVTSDVATLTLIYPVTISSQPQGQTIAVGQRAFFSVAAAGTLPLNYQWNFNGTPIADATNFTLVINGVHTNNAGNYSVFISNSGTSTNSAAAILSVTNPVVTLTVDSANTINSNGYSFQVLVPAGVTYVILSSTNFQDWSPIATNVALTGNEIFTDASATNFLSQFYRALIR